MQLPIETCLANKACLNIAGIQIPNEACLTIVGVQLPIEACLIIVGIQQLRRVVLYYQYLIRHALLSLEFCIYSYY